MWSRVLFKEKIFNLVEKMQVQPYQRYMQVKKAHLPKLYLARKNYYIYITNIYVICLTLFEIFFSFAGTGGKMVTIAGTKTGGVDSDDSFAVYASKSVLHVKPKIYVIY